MSILSIRTAVLGGLTAAFAVGGFFVGYSKTERVERPKVVRPDFAKFPRNSIVLVLQNHAKELGIGADQLTRIRAVGERHLRAKRKLEEEMWQRRVTTAERIATGEWLPLGDATLLLPGWNFQRGAVYHPSIPWMGMENAPVNQELKAIVGKPTIDRAISLGYKIAKEDGAKAFDYAVSEEALNQLFLTPLQRRQFSTLRARVEATSSNPKGGPPRQDVKAVALYLALSLLDPAQALALQQTLWDRFCVEP